MRDHAPEFDRNELDELCGAVCNEVASETQICRLEAILRTHAEARSHYRRYLNLHAGLRRYSLASSESLEFPREASRPASRTAPLPIWRQRSAQAFAATFLISATAIFSMLAYMQSEWDHRPEVATITHPDRFIALLSQGQNMKWADPEKHPTSVGADLPAGWMHLLEGVARIDFNGGATVVLEGPALIQLRTARSAYLENGRLTALAPTEARGFTVKTPGSTLVDLGTEFGVSVSSSGDSELHVFDGLVSIALGSDETTTGEPVEVRAGSAKRVDVRGTQMSDIPAHAADFRRLKDLSSPYELAVRATQPIGYWRFDGQSPDRMINEMNATRLTGQYFGSVTFDDLGPDLGHGQSNNALRLSGDGAYAELLENPVLKTGAFALAMWVRADAPGSQSIIVGTAPEGATTHWSQQLRINVDRQFEIYGFDQDPNPRGNLEGGHYSVAVHTALIQPGHWYHVAYMGRDGGTYRLFIDGKQVATAPAPARFQRVIDRFQIGSPAGKVAQAAQAFEGAIDEIALYDRELTAEEVQALFDSSQGKPE